MPGLRLLIGVEQRDDLADHPVGGTRVHGRQHQMAGLGGTQHRIGGIAVAHLAHHDHVRALAQRLAQPVREAGRVDPDLALGNHAARPAQHVLDGLLDRDDVRRRLALLHDVAQRGEQRGGLAGAGRASDDHQALAAFQQQPGQEWRQPGVLQGQRIARDAAHHQPQALTGIRPVHVHPQARLGGQIDRTVDRLATGERRLPAGQHAIEELLYRHPRHRTFVAEVAQAARQLQCDRRALDEVDFAERQLIVRQVGDQFEQVLGHRATPVRADG